MRLNLSIIVASVLSALFLSSCERLMQDDLIDKDELPLSTKLELTASRNAENPSNQNDVVFTASLKTLKTVGGILPTGSISFFENENILCLDVSVDQKKATCRVTFTVPGNHTITAIYNGDEYYAESTSEPLLHNISTKILTSISLTHTGSSQLGNTLYLSARLENNAGRSPIDKPTGAIVFQDNGKAIRTVNITDSTDLSKIEYSYVLANAGSHQLSVQYTGDVNYENASPESPITLNVPKRSFAFMFDMPSLATVGQSIVVSIEPNNILDSVPLKGKLSFFDKFNGQEFELCSDIKKTDSKYNCTFTPQSFGSHKYFVRYTNDTNYEESESPSPYVTVQKIDTQIIITSPFATTSLVAGDSVQLTAQVTRNYTNLPISGSITFKDGGVNIPGCTNLLVLNDSYLLQFSCPTLYQIKTAQSHNFTAIFSGNDNYKDSDSSLSPLPIAVGKIVTSVVPKPSATLLNLGAQLILGAELSGVRASVPLQASTFTFKENGRFVCSVHTTSHKAECDEPLTMTAAGRHDYTVEYDGDENYQSSVSALSSPVNVAKGAVSINAFKAEPDSIQIGDSVLLTAQARGFLNSPVSDGTFEFMEDSNPVSCDSSPVISKSSVDPIFSCSVPIMTAGLHTYSAHYGQDSNYADADSQTKSVNVKALSTTALEQPSAVTVGNQITLKATLSTSSNFKGQKPSVSGDVVFKEQVDAQSQGKMVGFCTLEQTAQSSSCSVSFQSENTGNYKYVAYYRGDSNYVSSESAPKIVVVEPVRDTITLSSTESEWIRSESLTLVATLPTTAHKPAGTVKFTGNIPRETSQCQAVPLIFSNGKYVAECKIPKLFDETPRTFTAEYLDDRNNLFSPATLPLRNVLIPTKIEILLKSAPFTTGKDLVLNAKLDIADGLPTSNLQGRVKFFDNENLISGCDVAVSEKGIIECGTVLNYTRPTIHFFRVEYKDSNTPASSTFAEKYESISIDTSIPNSPIYLLTGSGKISISTTGGRSWLNTQEQPGGDLDRALALFVTEFGDIYVGTAEGHIYYSSDKGNKGTWKEVLPSFNTDGGIINALYITTNHELLVASTKENASVLKQLQLNKSGATWETLGSSSKEFGGQKINAVVAFPVHDNTSVTKIILAHDNGALTCRNGKRTEKGENQNWIKNNFRGAANITSLYVGTDGNGRELFFGTSDGKIYKNKKNLDDNTTDPFGGYCPDTNPSAPLVVNVNGPDIQAHPITGLFITPSNLSLFYPLKDKTLQNFSTIYALGGNKVSISKDAGSEWISRDLPDEGNEDSGTGLFVTPIMYAANYLTQPDLPYERDIKISNDGGRFWYSLKDSLKPLQLWDPRLGAWFVTPQNGFLFVVLADNDLGYIHNRMVFSINGGVTWKNDLFYSLPPIHKDKRVAFTTALWVEFEHPRYDYDLSPSDVTIVAAHEGGYLTLVNAPKAPGRGDYYVIQPTSTPGILSTIQPAGEGHVLEVSSVLNGPYTDSWKEFGGIRYMNFDNFDTWINPNNFFSTYSLAINSSTKTWYASTSTSPTESIIRKTTDNIVLGWSDMNSPYGADKNRIPIILFSINDSTLYASFIKSRNANDEKDAGIFVTTDDGKTWEPLKTQPYSGVQGAFKIFAQYQYN